MADEHGLNVSGLDNVNPESDSSDELQPASTPIQYDNDMFKGALFKDFNQFEAVFDVWQCKSCSAYRKTSSEIQRYVGTDYIPPHIYKYIAYSCKHFGLPRSRSKGKRTHKSFQAMGCNAKIRVKYNLKRKGLEVTIFDTEHNHEIGEQYEMLPRNILPPLLKPEDDTEPSPKRARTNNSVEAESPKPLDSVTWRNPLSILDENVPCSSTDPIPLSLQDIVSSPTDPAPASPVSAFSMMAEILSGPPSEDETIRDLQKQFHAHLQAIRDNPEEFNQLHAPFKDENQNC